MGRVPFPDLLPSTPVGLTPEETEAWFVDWLAVSVHSEDGGTQFRSDDSPLTSEVGFLLGWGGYHGEPLLSGFDSIGNRGGQPPWSWRQRYIENGCANGGVLRRLEKACTGEGIGACRNRPSGPSTDRGKP